MSNIDKIVAEMPKSENHHKCYCDKYSPHTMTKGQIVRDARYHEWNEATKAQCQLLAGQGYRKVPSVDQILYRLTKTSSGGSLNDAKELHRWLLEGGNE